MSIYDAIVVGARCAGSPTAMLLARQGYRVLLVDQATFPSDTLSTHACKVPAAASLARWGLLDQIAASNCPGWSHITLDLGPFALHGTPPPLNGTGVGYAPRRRVLDTMLVEAAAEAGAEVRTGFAVDALVRQGERVVGVRGHGAGGSAVTEQAALVIGADGRHSFVAREVDAPSYAEQPSLTCAYYTYFSGLPIDGPELYPRPGCMIVTFPTNDGLTLVLVEWPHAQFGMIRADVEDQFLAALELHAPSLAERVRGGRREERFSGTADLPNFVRRPFGDGWALVGDAGLHRDPIVAQGIVDAFRDAGLLASAVDDGLSDRQPMSIALAAYEQQRNAAAMPMYEFTCQLAALQPPPPELQHLLTACVGNQQATNRLLGAIEGTVAIQEVLGAPV